MFFSPLQSTSLSIVFHDVNSPHAYDPSIIPTKAELISISPPKKPFENEIYEYLLKFSKSLGLQVLFIK